jgi:hypothetical protein
MDLALIAGVQKATISHVTLSLCRSLSKYGFAAPRGRKPLVNCQKGARQSRQKKQSSDITFPASIQTKLFEERIDQWTDQITFQT